MLGIMAGMDHKDIFRSPIFHVVHDALCVQRQVPLVLDSSAGAVLGPGCMAGPLCALTGSLVQEQFLDKC